MAKRIVFEKFTAATAFKGAVFSETKVCMASILYSKPGDNGTWIIFEPAYGFGAWVSISKLKSAFYNNIIENPFDSKSLIQEKILSPQFLPNYYDTWS